MDVLAVLGEFDAEAFEGTAVEAREEAFDDRARLQLERPQPRDDGRIEELTLARAGGHGYIPLRGIGTASISRSTITSGVTRSDSA